MIIFILLRPLTKSFPRLYCKCVQSWCMLSSASCFVGGAGAFENTRPWWRCWARVHVEWLEVNHLWEPSGRALYSRRRCSNMLKGPVWAGRASQQSSGQSYGLTITAVAAVVLRCSWRLCLRVQWHALRAMAKSALHLVFKEVGHESVVELPFECDRAESPALARRGTFARSSAPCSQEMKKWRAFSSWCLASTARRISHSSHTCTIRTRNPRKELRVVLAAMSPSMSFAVQAKDVMQT